MSEWTPPFKIPALSGIPLKKGPWVEVKSLPYSDGESRQWQGKPYRSSDEAGYKIKLATDWMDRRGEKIPDTNFYLDALPAGYTLQEVDQPGGPQTYKRLFGHPTGRFYDSITRFEAHFFWLMDGMQGECECILCNRGKRPAIPRRHLTNDSEPRTRRPREVVDSLKRNGSSRSNSATGIAGGREKRQLKPPGDTFATDEEGTKDIYKDCISKFYKARESRRGIQIDIDELISLDWQAERKSLLSYLTQISLQHSFVPRHGELVLWIQYWPEGLELVLDTDNGEYKFWSPAQKAFCGFPEWRAGVIAAIPTSMVEDGPIDFSDILHTPAKKYSLNTSGFRVETFPDPNATDKSLSKQYRYVPLRHIRPLAHWQVLIRGIVEKRLHPSIKYALTCMTSVSLLEKYQFRGEWPHASVLCRGLWLGAELITVGDTVRLFKTAAQNKENGSLERPRCTDVLVVSSIRLKLFDVQPEHATTSTPRIASRMSITLVGEAFTLDFGRAYRMPRQSEIDGGIEINTLPTSVPLERVKTLFQPVGTQIYGEWYPLQPEGKKYEVSYDRVLGRLYEADGVRLWTGLTQFRKEKELDGPKRPSLDFDLPGILSARKYATKTDERIRAPDSDDQILWYWADTRAQSLRVETINGIEVGAYDQVRKDRRTQRSWRAQLKIIDGSASLEDIRDSGLPQKKGRQVGSKVVNGKVVTQGDISFGSGSRRKLSMNAGAIGSQKVKSSSHMADAAMEETDEEDLDVELTLSSRARTDGSEDIDTQSERERSLLHQLTPSRRGKKPLSKSQIMESVEVGDYSDEEGRADLDGEEDDEEEDFTWPSLARGGTEESEGGDYKPAQLQGNYDDMPLRPEKRMKLQQEE